MKTSAWLTVFAFAPLLLFAQEIPKSKSESIERQSRIQEVLDYHLDELSEYSTGAQNAELRNDVEVLSGARSRAQSEPLEQVLNRLLLEQMEKSKEQERRYRGHLSSQQSDDFGSQGSPSGGNQKPGYSGGQSPSQPGAGESRSCRIRVTNSGFVSSNSVCDPRNNGTEVKHRFWVETDCPINTYAVYTVTADTEFELGDQRVRQPFSFHGSTGQELGVELAGNSQKFMITDSHSSICSTQEPRIVGAQATFCECDPISGSSSPGRGSN